MFTIDRKRPVCYNNFIYISEVAAMETVIKSFDEFNTRELYDILRARSEVFVVEQSCVYQDLDGIDQRAIHMYTADESGIEAYLRLFMKDDESKTVQIGRVLTVKRGCGLGLPLLIKAIEVARERLCAKIIYLEAQVYAIGFYEKAGFSVSSAEFLEDGIPHVQMILPLG